MIEDTNKVFAFAELSDEAKKVPIEEILDADCYFDDTDWFEPVVSKFSQEVRHLGLCDITVTPESMKLGGEGISDFDFTWNQDRLNIKLLQKEAPHIAAISGLNTQGHAHKVFFTKTDKYDKLIQNLGAYLYKQLMAHYDYMLSDEAVAIYLTENDHIKFTQEGEQI